MYVYKGGKEQGKTLFLRTNGITQLHKLPLIQVWRIMTVNEEGGIIINLPKSVEYKKTKGQHFISVTS